VKDIKKQNVMEKSAKHANREKNKELNEDKDSNANKKLRRW